MAPAPDLPGNMTVPPTFGWQDIASVLALLSVIALVVLLAGAAVASFAGRSEWQDYLGARSNRYADDAVTREDDVPARG
jgi:uncharacterized membrane protein